MAQWIEHQSVYQRVTVSIPSQGTCLGCRPGAQLGACERQPYIDVSLPLSFPSPSLKINKVLFFFLRLHSLVLEIKIETYLWRVIFQLTTEAKVHHRKEFASYFSDDGSGAVPVKMAKA